ncbi:hypothetical protein CHKEEEPN_3002 [Methylorubrum podarium]|jgi:hypothetical protein|nr:hypothetical protein CHKEEEPN_3002 [Methylorubrum podarium]
MTEAFKRKPYDVWIHGRTNHVLAIRSTGLPPVHLARRPYPRGGSPASMIRAQSEAP